MIKEAISGDNSIYLKNIDPNKRAIHIRGRMEHNLAEYAKYYSYRNIELLGGHEFTRKFDYNKRNFLGH
jgi:hypothetical protein